LLRSGRQNQSKLRLKPTIFAWQAAETTFRPNLDSRMFQIQFVHQFASVTDFFGKPAIVLTPSPRLESEERNHGCGGSILSTLSVRLTSIVLKNSA
jgi:hypothetical protein